MVVQNDKYKIRGYHGTLLERAKKILAGNYKIGHKRNDHWLGQGVYFFREDYEQARSWTIPIMRRNQKDGAVLITTFSIDSDAVMDLDSRKGLSDFVKLKERYHEFCIKNKIEIVANENVLRCAICDEIPKEIKVILRTFQGNAWFDQSLEEVDLSMHGKQVCVRDVGILNTKQTNIKGIVYYNDILRKRKYKPKKEFSLEKSD